MGKGGGGSAPAPDPQIGQAALENAQTGQDWLSFAKQAYGTQTQRQQPIDALSQQVTQQALNAATQQQGWATEAHNRQVNTFQPLQDQYIQQATSYDTPAKEQEAAATAKADVTANAAAQQAAADRQMTAMGVTPNSGRFAGITRSGNLNTAVAAAGAENAARQQVQATGLGLEANAINMGNGLPAQASAAAQLGLAAGTGAANVTNAANNEMLSAYPIMGQGYAGAMQGYSNQANILQNQYNSQLQEWEFQQQQQAAESQSIMSGIGSLAGLFMMSSKDFKHKKKKAHGSLDAVKSMPVERWRYKPGIADGGQAEHVGPYAEDFRRATGLGDGRTIPAQDAIGLTMGAVKELAGHVDKLKKQIASAKPKPDKPPSTPRHIVVIGIKPPHEAMAKPPKVKSARPPHGAHFHVHMIAMAKPKKSHGFSIRREEA